MKKKKLRQKLAQAQLATAEAEAQVAQIRAAIAYAEAEEQEKVYAFQHEQREQVQKEMEKNVATEQDGRRPSRVLWPEVTWDAEKKQFACQHSNITAWGDSPEMACSNFDHLWVFGR